VIRSEVRYTLFVRRSCIASTAQTTGWYRSQIHVPVPELCQNPICLGRGKLLFERKQLPQVVDNRHFRIELMECLEPEIILRNQQVAGSTPAGGSSLLQQVAVFVGVQAEAVHETGEIGPQGFGRVSDPGGNNGFHADAVLAFVPGYGFGDAAKLGLGLVADGVWGLRQDLVKKVFGCIVPVHVGSIHHSGCEGTMRIET
jgi:hypothetical protein